MKLNALSDAQKHADELSKLQKLKVNPDSYVHAEIKRSTGYGVDTVTLRPKTESWNLALDLLIADEIKALMVLGVELPDHKPENDRHPVLDRLRRLAGEFGRTVGGDCFAWLRGRLQQADRERDALRLIAAKGIPNGWARTIAEEALVERG